MDGVNPCPLSAQLAAVGFLVELRTQWGQPSWMALVAPRGRGLIIATREDGATWPGLSPHLCFLRAVGWLIFSVVVCPCLL